MTLSQFNSSQAPYIPFAFPCPQLLHTSLSKQTQWDKHYLSSCCQVYQPASVPNSMASFLLWLSELLSPCQKPVLHLYPLAFLSYLLKHAALLIFFFVQHHWCFISMGSVSSVFSGISYLKIKKCPHIPVSHPAFFHFCAPCSQQNYLKRVICPLVSLLHFLFILRPSPGGLLSAMLSWSWSC